MKTYPSKVDRWLAVLMVLPVIGGVVALASGIAAGAAVTVWIGVGSLMMYGLLLWGLVIPIEYGIADDGLHVRAGRMRMEIPWDRLRKAELSSNPLSSPALSLKRIKIEYQKESGKQTYVLISPHDREQFLSDLVASSPRHQLVDGKVVPKPTPP